MFHGKECVKPATIFKAVVENAQIVKHPRCKFHDSLVPFGFDTEDEAWAAHIAALLTQEYNDDD